MVRSIAVLSKCSPKGQPLGQSFVKYLNENLKEFKDEIIINDIDIDKVESSLDVLKKAEVIVADPPLIVKFLNSCHNLKWMQSTYAGVNMIMRNSTKRDFQLTRLSGLYFGRGMSEYVIGQIIVSERRLFSFEKDQKEKTWRNLPPYYRHLNQITLGIMGATGDIGSTIAHFAKSMGIKLKGFSRSQRGENERSALYDEMYYGKESLGQFLSSGIDYFVNVMPSTNETAGLLNQKVLKNANGSIFINIGRGDIIDEDSIIEALDQKWIRHAILDVFQQEPLPSSSRLWERGDITITPHVSGLTFPEFVVESFTKNLDLYLKGQKLESLVDWEKQY